MSATSTPRVVMPDPNFVHPELIAPTTRSEKAFRYVAGVVRIMIGWVFLWAFLDKLFGLGHDTASKASWINGGHPTMGFLKFATKGPLASFYHSFAGATWADWLFMIGLAVIGVSLMAGIAMRFAAASGALLLVLMWSAVLPPANNPFMDEHLIYAVTLIALALVGAGATLGFATTWERLSIVKRFSFLK